MLAKSVPLQLPLGHTLFQMPVSCTIGFFMASVLVERKQRCFHLDQVVVYFLVQMEPMELARRCFEVARKVQWLIEMHWLWSLHQ